MLTQRRFTAFIGVLLAILIFSGVSIANAHDGDDHSTTGSAVTVRWTNIYSAPNPNSATGKALPPNTHVTIVSDEGRWVKITSPLGDGYVPRDALRIGSTSGGSGGGGMTTTGNAVTIRWTNIYSAPNPQSSTGVAIPPGTKLTVTSIDMAWAKMESALGNGFVPVNAITQDEEVVGGGDAGGDMGGDNDGTPPTDLEKALADTVVNLYLEWNGQTRGPRVIQDIVNLVDMDALSPAKIAYDAETFFRVQLISAASADAIQKALIPATPDCDAIVGAYVLIALSPEFYSVPNNARNLVDGYERSVTSLVDTAKDAMLFCLKGGTFSDLNRNVAKTGAERAYHEFINIANAVAAMQ